MAVDLFEQVESRSLDMARESGSLPVMYVAVGSDDEAEVYRAVMAAAPATIYGLIRGRCKVDLKGNGLSFAVVEYKTGDAEDALEEGDSGAAPDSPEAIGGAGTGGPEGAPTDDPGTAPGETDPLDAGTVSGTTSGGTAHIVLSKETLFSARVGGFPTADTKRGIGVTRESVEGCDIVTAAPEFSVTRKRATMTLAFLRTLCRTTGKTNQAAFWGFEIGELLYLGCDYTGNNRTGWDLTHKFRYAENLPAGAGPANQVTADLVLTAGRPGHSYVWCSYREKIDPASQLMYVLPEQVFVERVYGEADFSALGLG